MLLCAPNEATNSKSYRPMRTTFLRVFSGPIHRFFPPDHKANRTQTNTDVLQAKMRAGWGAESPSPAPQIDPIATAVVLTKKDESEPPGSRRGALPTEFRSSTEKDLADLKKFGTMPSPNHAQFRYLRLRKVLQILHVSITTKRSKRHCIKCYHLNVDSITNQTSLPYFS